MAESYDASSSNSDGLSMMTIPPSIDRSSIPEESYLLAESKWWRLIEEGLIKKKKKTRSPSTKISFISLFLVPVYIIRLAALFVTPRKGGEEKVEGG